MKYVVKINSNNKIEFRTKVEDSYVAKEGELVVSEDAMPAFTPPSSEHAGVINYDPEQDVFYYEYALFEERQKLF